MQPRRHLLNMQDMLLRCSSARVGSNDLVTLFGSPRFAPVVLRHDLSRALSHRLGYPSQVATTDEAQEAWALLGPQGIPYFDLAPGPLRNACPFRALQTANAKDLTPPPSWSGPWPARPLDETCSPCPCPTSSLASSRGFEASDAPVSARLSLPSLSCKRLCVTTSGSSLVWVKSTRVPIMCLSPSPSRRPAL